MLLRLERGSLHLLREALEVQGGYRYLDSAVNYENETEVGEALRELYAPFLRTDRHQELLDLLRWYARAYSFAGLSPDHLGVDLVP